MSPENQIRLELLRSAPLNSWVAFSGDESRIVGFGSNYREVAELADAAGEPDAVILKTPTVWSAFSVQDRVSSRHIAAAFLCRPV